MQLVECYIENFGKLHEFTYKFHDGLNTINELNGWGKTTFAAFVRAMFYGMEVTRAKDLDKAERRKYKPWQGGKFGGYIIFELNGQKYKMERFFEDKEKDDTFVLYNQSTGLVSNDFTENIGEEIFKLDRVAYSRSTYIPQNGIAIETNDSINAKLSNLIEDDNDINNYDSAMKILDKCKKEYIKTGSRGKLDVIRNKITTYESALESCLSKGEAVEAWMKKLESIIINKKDVKDKLHNIKGNIEAASKYEGQVVRLQQYQELCKTQDKLQEDFAPLHSFFKESIPTDEELRKCDEISSDLLQLQGELKTYELTDYEKKIQETGKAYFTKGIPEEKEINNYEELITKYRENKIKIDANELNELEKQKKAELDLFFEKGEADESQVDRFIDKIQELNELKSKITTEKSKLEILKNVQATNNQTKDEKVSHGNKILIASIIMVILGAAFLILFLPLGVGLLVLGGVLFAVAKLRKKNQQPGDSSNTDNAMNNQRETNIEIQGFIDDLIEQKNFNEEELNHFLLKFPIEINPDNYYSSLTIIKSKISEFNNLVTKIHNQDNVAIKNEQNSIVESINVYLEPYCSNLSISVEQKEDIWKEVKSRRIEYVKINEKLSKYKITSDKLEDLRSQLLTLLKTYFDESNDNLGKNVNVLKERRKEYLRLLKEIEESSTKKEQFENENDITTLKDTVEPKQNLKELQDNEKTLYAELEEITSEENSAREQIRVLSDDADRCSDLQAEIEQLNEELSLGEEQLEILNKTMKCMENAKEKFSTHYMNGINQGFEQYIKMLDDGTLRAAQMDVQLNVNVSANGSQKSIDYFSTGYKDLIGICTRFALVDALFENEIPFIILDDPFVNLDGEKLSRALDMIGEISKKYQILYFVCHESRVMVNC